MEENRPKKAFYRNGYGVNIVMCCASCAHKVFDKGGLRVCTKGEGTVRTSYLCSDWVLSPKLDNAGKGGGKVKKKDYLKFVLNYPRPKPKEGFVTLSEIREVYEKLYGQIYMETEKEK